MGQSLGFQASARSTHFSICIISSLRWLGFPWGGKYVLCNIQWKLTTLLRYSQKIDSDWSMTTVLKFSNDNESFIRYFLDVNYFPYRDDI